MARTQSAFRQSDLKRAVKGALDAGLPIAEVRLTADGTIRILTTTNEPPEPSGQKSPLTL